MSLESNIRRLRIAGGCRTANSTGVHLCCRPIRGGWIIAGAMFCALVSQPVWALELTEIDQINPREADTQSGHPMGPANLDHSTSQFAVTPGFILGRPITIEGAQNLPVPTSSMLFFTPRIVDFGGDRGSEAGNCKFISPEIDDASCYKYAVGAGASLALSAGQATGLAAGSAMDQALAQGLTQGLNQELSNDLQAGLETGSGVEKAFALGFAYQKRVQDVDLSLSTSLSSTALEEDNTGQVHPEFQSWKLGLSAGYTGFTFSTSYFENHVQTDGEPDQFSNLDGQETFDLGVKYDLGPWAFGVQYSHSELDRLRIGPDLGDQKVDSYEIGGSYLLGQRLSLGAAIQFWKWGEFAGVTAEDDGQQDLLFLVGSHFKF